MKTGQVVFGLVAVIGLVIAFEVGRHLQIPAFPGGNPNTRLITISASSDAGKCTVDFPVALLRYSQNSVQWASNDSK
jgi:hypothetical protein